MLTIPVALSDNPYDVIVGHGARHLLAQTISELHNPPKKVAIITEVNLVDAGWLGGLDSGCEQVVFTIEGGEGGKSLATVEMLCRKLVTAGFSRNDLVVGVGGGIVTDVAGFVAAIYHRGIRYLSIATSLLAQVDAAVGGKTAVNLAEGAKAGAAGALRFHSFTSRKLPVARRVPSGLKARD